MRKTTLKELTIKDNFMFGAVMSDEENCRRLIELILQFPIERVMPMLYLFAISTRLVRKNTAIHLKIDA